MRTQLRLCDILLTLGGQLAEHQLIYDLSLKLTITSLSETIIPARRVRNTDLKISYCLCNTLVHNVKRFSDLLPLAKSIPGLQINQGS